MRSGANSSRNVSVVTLVVTYVQLVLVKHVFSTIQILVLLKKQQQILEAEGQAEALMKVQTALADSIKLLNADNKVSLFVRYIDHASGETETRIVNKNV